MFVIQVTKPDKPNQHWLVSRTSNARMYGGSIRLTADREEAKRFTRQRDALSHAKMIDARCHLYDFDKAKFGLLICEVKEI